MMKAIVAVDNNWAIGNGNKLLFSIPEDMKFFRKTTTGHTVVMGRKTLESFPGGKPLKNRKNIIISHDKSYLVEGAVVVHNLDELKAKTEGEEEVFVIGGASIYAWLLDLCDTVYVTKMFTAFPADAYFPNLDNDDKWNISNETTAEEYEDIQYSFVTYERKI